MAPKCSTLAYKISQNHNNKYYVLFIGFQSKIDGVVIDLWHQPLACKMIASYMLTSFRIVLCKSINLNLLFRSQSTLVTNWWFGYVVFDVHDFNYSTWIMLMYCHALLTCLFTFKTLRCYSPFAESDEFVRVSCWWRSSLAGGNATTWSMRDPFGSANKSRPATFQTETESISFYVAMFSFQVDTPQDWVYKCGNKVQRMINILYIAFKKHSGSLVNLLAWAKTH